MKTQKLPGRFQQEVYAIAIPVKGHRGFDTALVRNWINTLLLSILFILALLAHSHSLKAAPIVAFKNQKAKIAQVKQNNTSYGVDDALRNKIKETLKQNAQTIRFMENNGQLLDPSIRYYFECNSGSAYIYADHIRFVVQKSADGKHFDGMHTFSIRFPESNPNVRFESSAQFRTKFHYFGNEQNPNQINHALAAKDITLKELYPGIDLRLYSSKEGSLEFDWIINAHADFNRVKMDFNGQDALNINSKGKLEVGLRFTTVDFQIPESYQVSAKGKVPVKMAFEKVSSHTIAFSSHSNINKNLALVIDPILSWGTFMDGNNSSFDEYLYAIQIDPITGYVYCAGATNRQIPTSSAPYDADGYLNTVSGLTGGTGSALPVVAVIYRVNASGNDLLDLTLFGPTSVSGSNKISAYALSLSDNKVFVGGATNVTIPSGSTSAFDNSFSGSDDGWMACFSRDLGTLTYSSYLGSSGADVRGVTSIRALSDNSFVVGMTTVAALPTSSPNYISSGVVQSTFSGNSDFYIAKFSNYNTLNYGTYIGGNSGSTFTFNDLEVLSDGRIAFCGYGTGTITSVNDIASGSNSSDEDGVIGVLNSSVTAYNFIDKIGGSGNDRINDVEIVGDTIYWTGAAASGFPVSGSGVYSSSYAGGSSDVVVGKVYVGGGSAGFKATYYGTSGTDLGNGIRLVSQTNCSGTSTTFLLVFGTVGASGMPTQNINGESFYSNSFAGGLDIFFAGFTSNLSSLNYATYIGGSSNDYLGATGDPRGANHLWINGANVYVGTTVHSTTLTPDVLQNGFDDSRSSAGNDAHLIFSIQFATLLVSDYSDAPSSYGNAAHILDCTHLKMGTVDSESGAQNSTEADGDDTNGSDDEDAITTIPVIYNSTTSYSLTVNSILNSTSSTANIYAWVDFNGNGTFESNELANTTVASGTSSGSVTLNWTGITVSGNAANRYIRVRITTNNLTDDANTSVDERASAQASDGEVEDYRAVGLSCPTAQTENPCQTQAAINAKFATWLATASAGGCSGTLSNNAGSAPSVTSGGTATVTFTYVSSCKGTITCTSTFTVQPKSTINVSSSKTDVLCYNGNTGAITLTVSGGNTPYTYLWSNGATTKDISTLIAGTYNVTVTDVYGCTGTASVTISQPSAALSVSIAAQSNVTCYGSANGALNISATGGTPTYQYKYDGGSYQTSNNFNSLAPGTNPVTVMDANGCTASISTTITEPSALNITIASQTNVTCYGASTGAVTVTTSGGTPSYQYKIGSGSYQSSATFSGLSAGTYVVTVKDNNNCTALVNVTITQPGAAFTTSISSQTNVACYGNSTGSATVAVSGGSSPFTYSWNTSPAQTSSTATNLSAGAYTVTVTGSNGCSTTATATITQASAALSSSVGSTSSVSCYGGSNGSATISATGGTSPYQYKIGSGTYQSSSTFSGLSAGSYTVTIKDANNCTTTQSFSITQPSAALSASCSHVDPTAYGTGNGSVSVSAGGGTSPYTYLWNNGASGASVTGLSSGTYSVVVTDARGCTANCSTTFNNFPLANTDRVSTNEDTPLNSTVASNDTLSADGGNVFSNTCTVCTSTAHGTLTLNANGTYTYTPNANYYGNDQFIYRLCDVNNDCDTAIVYITINSVNDLPVANADRVSTNEDTQLNGTLATNDVPSGDGGNVWSKVSNPAHGTVTVNADGSYTYTPDANYNGSDSFIYQICDIDNDCDTALVTINVISVNDFPFANADIISTNEDTPISGTLTTNDVLSGDGGNVWSLTVAPTHGTVTINSDGSYTYTPDANYNGSDAFVYRLCDVDYDCDTAFVTINVIPVNDLPIANADVISTNEDTPISGTLTTNDVLSGDGGNIWSLTVAPAHGTVTINSDGTYTYTPDANYNGSDAFVYRICDVDYDCDTALVTLNIISVNDLPIANADAKTTSENTSVSINVLTNDDFGGDGPSIGAIQLNLQASHGTATVNTNGTPNDPSDDYFVYTPSNSYTGNDQFIYSICDVNGDCDTALVSITINPSSMALNCQVSTPITCYNGNDGSVNVNVSNGQAPFQYLWNTGASTSSISGLSSGNYQVTVTDAIQVTRTCSITLNNPSAIQVQLVSKSNASCYGLNNGMIDIRMSDITHTYSYTWTKVGNGVIAHTEDINALSVGTYVVEAISNNGCIINDTFEISQPNELHVSLLNKANPDCAAIASGHININVQGGTSAYNYVWTKSGNNSYIQYTQNIYQLSAGTYQVIVSDANACTDTFQTSLISGTVTADFDAHQLDCDGHYQLVNNSVGADGFIWSVQGSGPTTSPRTIFCTSSDTVFIYSFLPGSYTIKLIATSDEGCSDTIIKTITIMPKPIALFAYESQACSNTVQFTNLTVNGLSALWNFGDASSGVNNTSVSNDPSHAFTSDGNYSVRLIASDAAGCSDTITRMIPVNSIGTLPHASFTSQVSPGACVTKVYFTNGSSNAVSYRWIFDDGSSNTLTNPSKTYPYAGVYTVKLIAISASGCSDTSTQTITINSNSYGAVARFAVSDTVECLSNNRFSFINQSLYYGGGWVSSYQWDFGDNTSNSTNTFIYDKTYAHAGVYNVRLIGVSSTGCRDTAYQTIRVKPSADPTFIMQIGCTKTATLTHTVDSNATYIWSFGDGTYLNSKASLLTHTFATAGLYDIKLTTYLDNGCSDTYHIGTIAADGHLPTADFTYYIACGNNIQFVNNSTWGGNYIWNFGDGTPQDSSYDPYHSYLYAGTYNVTLTNYSSNECRASITIPVLAPQGYFSKIPKAHMAYYIQPCTNVIIARDSSSKDASSFYWYLNGSLVATGANVSIPTNGPGFYSLMMIADNGSCKDTVSSGFEIQERPVAAFNLASNSCSNTVIVNNQSTHALSYVWDFGDPASSYNLTMGNTAAHNYESNGTFNIRLIAFNITGCADTLVKSITLSHANSFNLANFSFNNALCNCRCQNNVRFRNTTPGNNNVYLWSFGDGSVSNETSPSKGFPSAGTFYVTLTAVDSLGCLSSKTKAITIDASVNGPSASFSTDNQVQCIDNNNFNFYNTSTYMGTGFIQKYYWYFGDGTMDSTNSFIYNKHYANAGNYIVTLIAVGNESCRDTMSMYVQVKPTPCSGSMQVVNLQDGTNWHLNPGFGHGSFSGLTTLDLHLDMKMYPNPNSGSFTIELSEAMHESTELNVVDMFGKVVYHQTLNNLGSKEIPVEAEHLSDGTYALILRSNNHRYEEKKFMIIH